MFATLELLAKRRRELDAAEAAWVREVGAFDRSGDWQIDKHWSAASALRHACHLSHGVARAYVDLARKLEKLPLVDEAFAAGDISARHAMVIAAAFTPARAAEMASVEGALVDAAREFTPYELGGLVRHVTDAIDGDGGADKDKDQLAQSTLTLSKSFDGMLTLDGRCDPLTGEIITTALTAQMARDFQASDERSTGQRRMDALGAICRAALARGDVGESHGIRPQVSVVVNLEELDDISPEAIAAAWAERREHGFLSKTTVEFLLCDCELTRILVTGTSEVLDVGRAHREPSAAQWKALVARDKHCQAPGCTRGPESCHAHHIVHWIHGGRTDLANLQLLCWHHHRRRHIDEDRAKARAAPDRRNRASDCVRAGECSAGSGTRRRDPTSS